MGMKRMDVNDDCSFMFERDCLSSTLNNAASLTNVENQILFSDWDPFLSMDPRASFHESASFPSHLVGLPGFQGVYGSSCGARSKIFTDMMDDSLGLYETGQVRRSLCSSGFSSDHDDHDYEKNIKRKKKKGMLQCESSVTKLQEGKAIREENVSLETVRSSSERDENKANGEEGIGCHNQKPTGKNVKENPISGDTAKVDYIHVRAKRGQATNSHSLAERVRREKISERMKLLQNLVPGCNKITGKAMMLDEIINYVQSLQRQVEFLSMKLAAINPGISSDIEQIFSKDILHSHGGSAASFGSSHGMSLPPHSFRGLQSDLLMCNIPRISAHSIPWTVQLPSPWERGGDLHGVIPNGLVVDVHADCKELNGTMKVEQ